METRIALAGRGGDGIVTLGTILAKAALQKDKHVLKRVDYGIEKRGGPVICELIISDKEIESPISDTFDWLISIDNDISKKYENISKNILSTHEISKGPKDTDNNQNFIESKSITKKEHLAANMITLGRFIRISGIFERSEIEKTIRELGKDTAKNIKSLAKGYDNEQ